MNADNFANDYLPFPPTPTNNACPGVYEITQVILQICFIASSNNIRFISTKLSL